MKCVHQTTDWWWPGPEPIPEGHVLLFLKSVYDSASQSRCAHTPCLCTVRLYPGEVLSLCQVVCRTHSQDKASTCDFKSLLIEFDELITEFISLPQVGTCIILSTNSQCIMKSVYLCFRKIVFSLFTTGYSYHSMHSKMLICHRWGVCNMADVYTTKIQKKIPIKSKTIQKKYKNFFASRKFWIVRSSSTTVTNVHCSKRSYHFGCTAETVEKTSLWTESSSTESMGFLCQI